MSFSKTSAVIGALAFASKVYAHGAATGIVADGVYYQGYSANFQYMQDPPLVAGWSTPENTGNGFVGPSAYTDPDIICHLGATPGGASAIVAAGGKVEIQWTAWPASHKGPVIDYLANCDRDCTTVDKTTLEFFKIDGPGLIDAATSTFASDELIANNNTWVVTIPSDIAPGNYVLRHEIIGLHSAGNALGAQNYPQCFNLEVTGSGTASPAGIPATEFYTPTDPGVLFNLYTTLTTYEVPGPALYSGAIEGTQPTSAAASSAASTSVASPESTSSALEEVPATTAPATTDIALPVTTTISLVPVVTSPPFNNSTTLSTKKSACKSKTKRPTTTAIYLPTGVLSAFPTASGSVSPVATQTQITSAPTPIPTAPVIEELPEGTTLGSVLAWISSFYTKNEGSEYDGSSTLTRRHARELAY